MPFETIPFTSWAHFKCDFLSDLMSRNSNAHRLVFRGVPNPDWPIKSSFDRLTENLPETQEFDPEALHKQMIDKFSLELQEIFGTENYSEFSHLQFTALAQHYGLPTRLIDWSDSPYVAAFFAFSSLGFLIQHDSPPNDVAIWVVDPEQLPEKCTNFRCPRIHNERIRNQEGLFIKTEPPSTDLRSLDGMHNDNLLRILIPASERGMALEDLRLMGITAKRLFPDISGLADHMKFELIQSILQ